MQTRRATCARPVDNPGDSPPSLSTARTLTCEYVVHALWPKKNPVPARITPDVRHVPQDAHYPTGRIDPRHAPFRERPPAAPRRPAPAHARERPPTRPSTARRGSPAPRRERSLPCRRRSAPRGTPRPRNRIHRRTGGLDAGQGTSRARGHTGPAGVDRFNAEGTPRPRGHTAARARSAPRRWPRRRASDPQEWNGTAARSGDISRRRISASGRRVCERGDSAIGRRSAGGAGWTAGFGRGRSTGC